MKPSTLLLVIIGIVFVTSFWVGALNLNLVHAIYVSAYCICRTIEKANEQ